MKRKREPGAEFPGTEPAGLAQHGRAHTDWIVYGVTAVLSVAFVIWAGRPPAPSAPPRRAR